MTGHDRQQHISDEDLSTYADGEIWDPADRLRIEQHLASCERCRQDLEELRSISLLLADLPEAEVPRSFRLTPADIAAGGESPEPVQPWILRHHSIFRFAGLAAAVLLVVVVIIDLTPGSNDDDADTITFLQEPAEEAESEDQLEEPSTMRIEDDEPAMESEAMDQDAAIQEEAPLEDSEAALDSAEEALPAEDAPDADEEARTGEAEPDEADGTADMPPTAEEEDADAAAPLTIEAADEGLPALRIAAVVLALISIALLVIGFIRPMMSRFRGQDVSP